jgi:hypothetical protein
LAGLVPSNYAQFAASQHKKPLTRILPRGKVNVDPHSSYCFHSGNLSTAGTVQWVVNAIIAGFSVMPVTFVIH